MIKNAFIEEREEVVIKTVLNRENLISYINNNYLKMNRINDKEYTCVGAYLEKNDGILTKNIVILLAEVVGDKKYVIAQGEFKKDTQFNEFLIALAKKSEMDKIDLLPHIYQENNY